MEEIWTEAIKEAYASAPLDIIILSTLELRHVSWTEPVRLVCDTLDLTAKTEDYIEAEVIVPGEVVTFLKCAFQAIPPESSDRLPEIQIQIDNVSREIGEQVDLAMTVRSPIEIIYREYLSTDPLNGPHYVLKGLTLRRVTVNESSVTGTATFGDLVNRAFPRELFTAERFPGLVR